jgi:hypothetical protein
MRIGVGMNAPLESSSMFFGGPLLGFFHLREKSFNAAARRRGPRRRRWRYLARTLTATRVSLR